MSKALVGFQGLMLAWASGRLNPFIRLLKNNAFKDDAGRANRVVRYGYIHDPGIQQEPQVIKRGFDDTEPARQRYECHDCDTRFDDLTDTIFAGHHQPLKVWILCLYFMGLNLSNEQMAQELALNGSDVQQMTAQRREGIVKKSPR